MSKVTKNKRNKTLLILVIMIIISFILLIFLEKSIENEPRTVITIGSIDNPKVLGKYETAYTIMKIRQFTKPIINIGFLIVMGIYTIIALIRSQKKIIELVKTVLKSVLITIFGIMLMIDINLIIDKIMGVDFKQCRCGPYYKIEEP